MSQFDPAQFVDATCTEANDTKVIPVPVGEYMGICSKVEARTWASKADPTKSGVTLDITWDIEDEGVKSALGRDKITVRQGVMLDVTASGGLDFGKGKNVGLGRVREALSLNTAGQPFAPSMFVGRPAKVSVTHRIDGEDIFAEIKKVAKF
jgi:hypothetical protein